MLSQSVRILQCLFPESLVSIRGAELRVNLVIGQWGLPRSREQSKASNHLSNKEGDRSLYLKPGNGDRKLENQKLEKLGVSIDSIGRAGKEECDKAPPLMDSYALMLPYGLR